MDQAFRSSQLVPKGFVVERTTVDDGRIRIWVRSANLTSLCPSCGTISRRVHSRYLRRPSDLPLVGHRVSLHLTVCRFRCDAVLCGQQVFAERFAEDVLGCRARRTGRMEHIIHHLGLVLGGRPAASFALRLMLPVRNDGSVRQTQIASEYALPQDRLGRAKFAPLGESSSAAILEILPADERAFLVEVVVNGAV